MFGRLLSVIGLSARKKNPKYEQFLIIRSSCFISYVEMIYFPLFSFRNLTLFVISMRKLSKCNLILAFSLSLSIRTSLCPSPFLFYLRTVYYDIVRYSWNVVFWMDVNGEQIEKKNKGSKSRWNFLFALSLTRAIQTNCVISIFIWQGNRKEVKLKNVGCYFARQWIRNFYDSNDWKPRIRTDINHGLSLYETKNNRILIELKTNLLKDVYIIRAKDRKVIEK